MAMPASEIERLIKDSVPDAEVTIEDLRGDGDHYAAYVMSPAFSGKSRVQQHQMVYKSVGDYMTKEIHALEIKTSTKDALKTKREI